MSGTLFVVATPIGNLEDVTLRALRILRTVSIIAAEDTRRTGRLLAYHAISTPTISFHQHNLRSRLPQLLARLQRDQSVALVTDAGTPGVSDPGIELVEACVRAGIPVDPVPGVSAPLAAAVASGFPLIPLTILGFAPTKAKDRLAWLKGVAAIQNTVTFFEAPHRIAQTMAAAGPVFGERQIMVGRELTKAHQEFVRGTASALVGRFENAKGEFTIVVGPPVSYADEPDLADDSAIFAEFCRSTEVAGRSRREAINSVARKYGVPARQVYQVVERLKNVPNDQ